MLRMQAECHKTRVVIENSKLTNTNMTMQQPSHMPSENTITLGRYHRVFWVSQYISEKLFSHYGLLYFLRHVTIHYPPPHPLSGAQIRSIPGRQESGRGVIAAWPGGGGLRATHYYHMHTSRGCLGAWGYRGMYAILAISCLCQKESLKGLKDERHSTPLN